MKGVGLDFKRRVSRFRQDRQATAASARQREAWIVGVVCLGFSLFVLWPIISTPSWYVALQAYRYPYLLRMFREQVLAGHLYPRWLPDLEGGYGYPTFVFYPPGFWYVALPWSLLGLDDVLACKLTLVGLFVLAGCGVYSLAGCWCRREPALASTMVFYLSPYFATQLYARGCLSELSAGLLSPWVFFHLVMVGRRIGRGEPAQWHVTWLAITVAATLYMHPQVAIWMIAMVIPCAVGVAIDSGRFWAVARSLVWAAILAIALAAPYWAPVFTLASELKFNAERARHIFFAQVPLRKLVNVDSIYAGPFLPMLAFAGFLFGRRSWFLFAAMLCAGFLFWYVTPSSMWLRRSVDTLHYLQHPIRVLAVFATLQAIGIAVLFGRAPQRLVPLLFVAVGLLAFSSADAYQLRGPLDFESFREKRAHSFENMTHMNEFMPRGASVRGLRVRLRDGPIAVAPRAATLTMSANSAGEPIEMRVETDVSARIVVRQFYFPGWQVKIDNKQAVACPRSGEILPGSYCRGPNGQLAIIVPKGTHTVRVEYTGVPWSLERNALIVVVLMVYVFVMWIRKRPIVLRSWHKGAP